MSGCNVEHGLLLAIPLLGSDELHDVQVALLSGFLCSGTYAALGGVLVEIFEDPDVSELSRCVHDFLGYDGVALVQPSDDVNVSPLCMVHHVS